jgi:hypothetical protein
MLAEKKCQLFSVPGMSDPLQPMDTVWQHRNRLKRIFKRRWNYLKNAIRGSLNMEKKVFSKSDQSFDSKMLRSGDRVKVRSKEEIQTTLNRWNQLKGCSFMEEMWPYCGTTQRVLKMVEKFLDERDYLKKKCRGIIILEGVMCQGTKDFGLCDRSCFFFWREEWLEKAQ